MDISVGRTVHFSLTAEQAAQVNRRRTDGMSIRDRMQADPPTWPAGAQAHIGNTASEGDIVPLVVVRVWPNEFGEGKPGVNGQAFLDGNDALWVTSAAEGPGPGQWQWPPRV